jgi:hypothetical protein
MLRVTLIERDGSATLKLEGKLSGPWVDEMEQCWAAFSRQRGRVRLKLNLQDLTYADNRGRDLLLQMEYEGASLMSASEFLWHLLHDEGSSGDDFGKKQNKNEEVENGSPLRS